MNIIVMLLFIIPLLSLSLFVRRLVYKSDNTFLKTMMKVSDVYAIVRISIFLFFILFIVVFAKTR